jgi:phage-related protein
MHIANNNLKVLDKAITFVYNSIEKGEYSLHKIYFYKDKNGNEPVMDYLNELAAANDKDSRIKFNKLNDYIQALSVYGLTLREPYIKHLDGDIWELRPSRDRILFVAWHNGGFVLLHQFMKTTQKTPPREIAKAKRELADIKERGIEYE